MCIIWNIRIFTLNKLGVRCNGPNCDPELAYLPQISIHKNDKKKKKYKMFIIMKLFKIKIVIIKKKFIYNKIIYNKNNYL